MNWFRENRFLGTFVIVLGVCTLGAGLFLFRAKSDRDDAAMRFNQAATELHRLERLAPYPNGENLREMKAYAEEYATMLARLKTELRTRAGPVAPMAPNEFQSHLRLAMTAVAEKARANKVGLPDKFFLGFDEFASTLPNEGAAPLLGQELAQIEWLLDTLFEARVDALTSFRRIPGPDKHGNAAPSPVSTSNQKAATAPAGPRSLERSVVEATFVSTPAAARRALNQIAGANQQFFIVRLLHIRNEKDTGPPRELGSDAAGVIAAASPSPAGAPRTKPSPTTALNFIVGNERIETSARIEIVRFTF